MVKIWILGKSFCLKNFCLEHGIAVAEKIEEL
jgi:hypothetical protein